MDNDKTYAPPKIPACEGRRFAIGDIHGCIASFKALVREKIQLKETDQLFLLGDYINRGPESKAVLDYIMELLRDDYQVFPVRGNHENKLLRAYDQGISFLEDFLVHYDSTDLFDDLSVYMDFCAQLPYYIELPDFFLSHINVNEGIPTPATDLRLMFPEVELPIDFSTIYTKYQIHGHLQTSFDRIKKNVRQRTKVISIDNGCYNLEEEGFGHLCALNMDTFQLIFQPNIEVYPQQILGEESKG